MSAPVVLFAYNRPEHLQRTVSALAANRLARETELWVFIDGPKDTRAAEGVRRVKQFVSTLPALGWFAGVSIEEASVNRGLAKSIIHGVTTAVARSGRVIVLEDDLVTAPDFLCFMNACLEYYRDDPRIGSISGYSPIREVPRDYAHDVYVLPRNCSLGWGTWADRWLDVDWDVRDFQELLHDSAARERFNSCGSDRFDRLRRQVEADIDSWSIRFGFWQFRQGKNTVYSSVNRVRNIGADGSGVHAPGGGSLNLDLPVRSIPFVLSRPAPDLRLIRACKRAYSGGALRRLARYVRDGRFARLERAGREVLRLARATRRELFE